MKKLVILFLLIAISSFAQEKKEEKLNTDFRFHSQIFFNYTYTKDAQGFNNDNNRFYVGFKKNINKIWSARFTLDVGKDAVMVNGTENTKYEGKSVGYGAFMKYGYLKAQLTKELSLTMGIFLNPIHGFSNKFWGHRYITSAYGGKYWNAVPQGVILDYKMGKLLKASLLFTNGSTYHVVGDNDKNKDIAFVITSSPVEGLDIALHGRYIIPVEDNAGATMQGTAFLGYSMKFFKLGYQFLFKSAKANKDAEAVKSMGHVIYARVMPLKEYELFGSFLMNDQNTDTDKDKNFAAIGGLEYKYSKGLKFALSYETKWIEEQEDNKEYTVRLSSYVNF